LKKRGAGEHNSFECKIHFLSYIGEIPTHCPFNPQKLVLKNRWLDQMRKEGNVLTSGSTFEG